MKQFIQRKPFQGVLNIVKFNWHFYLFAFIFLLSLLFFKDFLLGKWHFWIDLVFVLTITSVSVTLLVSSYIYDFSNLYSFPFLQKIDRSKIGKLVNINAGFDETSALLAQQFPNATLRVLDFYDAQKHTEISIKRARKAYPPFPNTEQIETKNINLSDCSIDLICLIFAAHEIRNEEERIYFFQQLQRALDSDGRVVLLEHLRNLPNFLAYNIGFFHFLSRSSWINTFEKSNFHVESETAFTPFVRCFILKKQ
ncbi:MAG: hypothetical protein RL757_2264 [Bacteroidota bacterium]|jgi:SAM-dependent methyltransferase